MSDHFAYYVFVLLALVAGIAIIRKVASCLVRTVVALVVIAVLVWIYFSMR